jgi:hypothetical protein
LVERQCYAFEASQLFIYVRGEGKIMNDSINLAEMLSLFSECWSPRTITHLNEYDIMVAKVQDEFTWH